MSWTSFTSRTVETSEVALQRRLEDAREQLERVKAERDTAIARAEAPRVSDEMRSLRAVALAAERRLCGVGSADEERRALADWRATL